MGYQFLADLEDVLKKRKEEQPEGSYTTSLFKGGLDRILKKIGEEAGEVIIAAKNDDQEELLNESADLLFHLMILLEEKNLSVKDVVATLEKRHKK